MVVTLGQQDNVGEKPTVILYTCINRHAEPPNTTKQKTLLFAYDSITVSSAWELTSVSMRYSQGEGVNTPCLGLCTVPTISILYRSIVSVLYSVVVPFLYVYGYLPWHGHVLPGAPVTKIMCVNQLYLQG